MQQSNFRHFFVAFLIFGLFGNPRWHESFGIQKTFFQHFFLRRCHNFCLFFVLNLSEKFGSWQNIPNAKQKVCFSVIKSTQKPFALAKMCASLLLLLSLNGMKSVWCEINRKLYLRVSFWSGCWNVLYVWVWVWVCLYMGCHLNFVRTLNLCCFTLPNNLAIHNSFANSDRLLWLW